jgi:hypothetical protein
MDPDVCMQIRRMSLTVQITVFVQKGRAAHQGETSNSQLTPGWQASSTPAMRAQRTRRWLSQQRLARAHHIDGSSGHPSSAAPEWRDKLICLDRTSYGDGTSCRSVIWH